MTDKLLQWIIEKHEVKSNEQRGEDCLQHSNLIMLLSTEKASNFRSLVVVNTKNCDHLTTAISVRWW